MLLQHCQNQSAFAIAVAPNHATVLVIDDDEEFRDLARQILEPGGFDVVEAEDLPQGLSRLRPQGADAIILDIVMPECDGLMALRSLKACSPRSKIVTVSGAKYSALYLRVSAHLGADASLDKSKIASLCGLLNIVLER
jgi:CheY-like chemotaxis protein